MYEYMDFEYFIHCHINNIYSGILASRRHLINIWDRKYSPPDVYVTTATSYKGNQAKISFNDINYWAQKG